MRIAADHAEHVANGARSSTNASVMAWMIPATGVLALLFVACGRWLVPEPQSCGCDGDALCDQLNVGRCRVPIMPSATKPKAATQSASMAMVNAGMIAPQR